MNGPWYENSGPHIEEVYKDIMHAGNVMKWLKKFPTENISTITEVGQYEIVKAGGKNLCYGSFRGYATFVRKDIIENIVSEFKKRKKAIDIINQSSILYNWINNILYRPPLNNIKKGLRYENVKSDFEKFQ